MKQYKLVAGPTTNQILDKNGDNSNAVASFANIIAQLASQGWSYHSMEPISTEQTKGCINKTTITMTFYMLIFEREV